MTTSSEPVYSEPTSSEPSPARPEQAPEVHTGLTHSPSPLRVSAQETPQASLPWDQATKRTVVVILLIAMAGVVWISRPVIPLLVVAGVVAYFLNPVVDLAERAHIPRTISTIALYLLLAVALILTPILLAPVLGEQLASLNFDVPSTVFRLFAWVGDAVNNLPDTVEILGFAIPLEGLTQQIEQSYQEFTFIPTLAEILTYFQQLISTATNLVSSTAAIGVTLVGSIVQVFVTIVIIFFLSLYLTKDAPRIRAYVEGLVPQSYQSEWIDLLRRMGYIWQAFFRGQFVLGLVIGVVTWLALELAGMPGALLLGILAGMLEIIPTLGPILAMIPAVFIALIQGSTVLGAYGVNNFGFALITVAIYFIIQQLENNLLVPRIIGGGVNLHPIVVVCGVAIGFNLFGILGALFAAPVIASLRVLGGYIHAKLLDYPPFTNQTPAAQRQHGKVVYRRTVTGEELAVQAALRATPRAESAAQRSLPAEPAQGVTQAGAQEIAPPVTWPQDGEFAPDNSGEAARSVPRNGAGHASHAAETPRPETPHAETGPARSTGNDPVE